MNILITSVGRRTYMIDYFKKALKGQGKVFAANSELTYALRKADNYVLVPNIYDSSYINFLLSYCKENEISALISLFDIDIPMLSENRFLFEQIGVRLLISDYSFVSMCNDKWQTYKYIKNNGFNAPNTYISLIEAKKAIDVREVTYPLIVKPRWGMGSIGVFEANNEEELNVFYKKTKNEILKSYLKYESIRNIDKSIIIQQKIEAEEWGLDIFNDLSGNYLSCVPKKKLAMRAGETDVAKISKAKELISFGKNVARVTQHISNLDMDFFIKDKEFYILEFNCRFGGQYPFSHIAGVDFPEALITMLNGNEPSMDCLMFDACTVFKDFEIRRI